MFKALPLRMLCLYLLFVSISNFYWKMQYCTRCLSSMWVTWQNSAKGKGLIILRYFDWQAFLHWSLSPANQSILCLCLVSHPYNPTTKGPPALSLNWTCPGTLLSDLLIPSVCKWKMLIKLSFGFFKYSNPSNFVNLYGFEINNIKIN